MAGFGLTFTGGQTTLIGAGTTVATNALLLQNGAGSPLTLLDIKDNGQFGFGGIYASGIAYKFWNTVGHGTIAQFLNSNGNPSVSIYSNGQLETRNASNQVTFFAYESGGQGHLSMKASNVAYMDLTTAGSYLSSTFHLGSVSAINAKAQLEITSTVRGVLLPRMTTTQKNNIIMTAAEEGMEVYDLTLSKKCVYTGAAWETITSA